MFRKFFQNRKAQNTAEYALLIALVVAGIIAMQTYAQRALQARVRDASVLMTSVAQKTATTIDGLDMAKMGNTAQYEPYYLKSEYAVDRDTVETQDYGVNKYNSRTDTTRSRDKKGYQESSYNGDEQLGH